MLLYMSNCSCVYFSILPDRVVVKNYCERNDRRYFPGMVVHNFVVFYLRFLYSMFKTKKYLNNRKVAEAVNRTF